MAATECEHPEIDEGICMKCSQVVDLSSIDITRYKKFPGGVLVLKEEAKRMKREKKISLFKMKKLILLLDLDNTVVHVNERDFGIHDEQIHQIQIKDKPYYVILRPGVIEFLKAISDLFEIRIVTQASRVYAAKILQLIDPEKKIQKEIYSREKSSLKDVPPSTPQSFTIIADDKISVWEKKLQKNVALVYPFIPWLFIKSGKPLKDSLRDKLLPRFEQFLKRIHKSFYENNCVVPIWKIEPFVEFKSLFRGIVALTEPQNGIDAVLSCFAELGGKVVYNENDSSITHVISKQKPNFDKNGEFVSLLSVNQRETKAQHEPVSVKRKKSLICVKYFWIIESVYHFERLDTKDFLWVTPKSTENMNDVSCKRNEGEIYKMEQKKDLQAEATELKKSEMEANNEPSAQQRTTEEMVDDDNKQSSENLVAKPLSDESMLCRKRCDRDSDESESTFQSKKAKYESGAEYDFYSTSEDEENDTKMHYIADDVDDDNDD